MKRQDGVETARGSIVVSNLAVEALIGNGKVEEETVNDNHHSVGFHTIRILVAETVD